ncbi:MAG: dTDP-4-dehydrorhamnose 3,5-epimerase family protein [Patescibacteria group bacterium]|nr:dTDP-4-dehydrorhamnose 3,5-epimerase family protein [Patescibacteria group bacterium]
MQTFQPSTQNLLQDGIYQTQLPGVFFVNQTPFKDNRGFYTEIARLPELDAVLPSPFRVMQTNLSLSKKFVARGFHTENWNKLITPLTGSCLSVLADIRPDSPQFGQILAFNFSKEFYGSIFVPAGVANSFLVLEGEVNYHYLVDALYKNRDQAGDVPINLFDPDLAVVWPIPREQMIISGRDRQAISLRNRFPQKYVK